MLAAILTVRSRAEVPCATSIMTTTSSMVWCHDPHSVLHGTTPDFSSKLAIVRRCCRCCRCCGRHPTPLLRQCLRAAVVEQSSCRTSTIVRAAVAFSRPRFGRHRPQSLTAPSGRAAIVTGNYPRAGAWSGQRMPVPVCVSTTPLLSRRDYILATFVVAHAVWTRQLPRPHPRTP